MSRRDSNWRCCLRADYLVEDIPHALISIASLKSGDAVSRCEASESSFEPPPVIAKFTLATSLGSMLFGIVRKTMQSLAQRAENSALEGATASNSQSQRVRQVIQGLTPSLRRDVARTLVDAASDERGME